MHEGYIELENGTTVIREDNGSYIETESHDKLDKVLAFENAIEEIDAALKKLENEISGIKNNLIYKKYNGKLQKVNGKYKFKFILMPHHMIFYPMILIPFFILLFGGETTFFSTVNTFLGPISMPLCASGVAFTYIVPVVAFFDFENFYTFKSLDETLNTNEQKIDILEKQREMIMEKLNALHFQSTALSAKKPVTVKKIDKIDTLKYTRSTLLLIDFIYQDIKTNYRRFKEGTLRSALEDYSNKKDLLINGDILDAVEASAVSIFERENVNDNNNVPTAKPFTFRKKKNDVHL